jgi:hypothetical protein
VWIPFVGGHRFAMIADFGLANVWMRNVGGREKQVIPTVWVGKDNILPEAYQQYNRSFDMYRLAGDLIGSFPDPRAITSDMWTLFRAMFGDAERIQELEDLLQQVEARRRTTRSGSLSDAGAVIHDFIQACKMVHGLVPMDVGFIYKASRNPVPHTPHGPTPLDILRTCPVFERFRVIPAIESITPIALDKASQRYIDILRRPPTVPVLVPEESTASLIYKYIAKVFRFMPSPYPWTPQQVKAPNLGPDGFDVHAIREDDDSLEDALLRLHIHMDDGRLLTTEIVSLVRASKRFAEAIITNQALCRYVFSDLEMFKWATANLHYLKIAEMFKNGVDFADVNTRLEMRNIAKTLPSDNMLAIMDAVWWQSITPSDESVLTQTRLRRQTLVNQADLMVLDFDQTLAAKRPMKEADDALVVHSLAPIHSLVMHLRAKGKDVAIASFGAKTRLVRILEKAGLRALFDDDHIETPPPPAEMSLSASVKTEYAKTLARRLGKEHPMMVEDSEPNIMDFARAFPNEAAIRIHPSPWFGTSDAPGMKNALLWPNTPTMSDTQFNLLWIACKGAIFGEYPKNVFVATDKF